MIDGVAPERKKYYMYYLYDPRNSTVCYVGMTNNFKSRLRQHQSPNKRLKTRIAKLQRHLLANGMSLEGQIISESYNKDYISYIERRNISRLRRTRGDKQIKNISDGGYTGYTLSEDVISRMVATRKLNNKPPKVGDDSPTAVLKTEDVLMIYSLIKSFYSDTEIVNKLNLGVGRTSVASIRRGANWKHLWEKEKMVVIPSIPTVANGLGTQEKIALVLDIENGLSTKQIRLKYGIGSTDVERIRSRTLWLAVWDVYDKFIKNKTKDDK